VSNNVHFELVTPERLLMEVDASGVVVPGSEGDFMVLPNHAPMLSTIRPGVIEVSEAGSAEPTRIFIRGGFAEVTAGGLTILAEEAIAVVDLSREDIEQRIQNTREDLEDAGTDEARRSAEEALARLGELLAATS
jgi:F-type H+-transporting ATPase subunit epsilon